MCAGWQCRAPAAPDPIGPYARCGTHPAPRSPRFGCHHRVTPDRGTLRAAVTVAEAEGTRCAQARLPALCFLETALSRATTTLLSWLFCDQTRSRRYLLAASRRPGQEAQLHWGGLRQLWGGTTAVAPGAASTLAGTFPRGGHAAPFPSRLPMPWVPQARGGGVCRSLGVHTGFSPCPAATLGRRTSPQNYPWVTPHLPQVTPHLPRHGLQKAFCESHVPERQLLL